MKIVADQHIPYLQDYFANVGELILKSGRDISAADVADADMLIVRSITRVDEQLLRNSRVKFVGSVTAGADHLDTHWLQQQKIRWQTAAGFNAPAVANYVDQCIQVLQGLNTTPIQTAAVIGVGHVGKRVVEKFTKSGINTILCDPLRAEIEKDFHSVPLEQIQEVDLISLHVPLTVSGSHPTYHFINEAFLKRQRPGCVLINTARGAVIDSNALLQAGRHLTWCFDVWENEPTINKLVLQQALLATPHIAGYSVSCKRHGTEMIYMAATGGQLLPIHSQINTSTDLDLLSITAQMKLLLSMEEVGTAFDNFRANFSR